MSTRQDQAPSPPVGSRDDLVAWIAAGSKPRAHWRIGTEHEKFLFHVDTLKPVPYAGPRGVRALMQSLIDRFGWQPIMEGDNIIALKRPEGEGGGTVSLEPGGQFELSGDPLQSVHEVAAETHTHLTQCLHGRLAARHRLPRRRLLAALDARRNAAHAQAALRRDDPLHAPGRLARPRHDVPHLHHPGEPRLRATRPTW